MPRDAYQLTPDFMLSNKLIIMKPSRPFGIKQPYLLILKSNESKLERWKVYSKGYNFVFLIYIYILSILMFTMSK